jgi:monoamine oxidase
MTGQNRDRRHFLRTAAAGALASTAIGGFPALGQSTGNPAVLILGAGLSGISASYWLRQFGISSLVLEGRTRIGGRLWTSFYWPDAPLDLGGAWIHDTPHSPLTPLCKQFGVQTKVVDFTNVAIYQATGGAYAAAQLATVAADVASVSATVEAKKRLLMSQGLPDRSLASVQNPALASLNLPTNPLYGVNSFFNFALGVRGADLSALSLYYYEDDLNTVAATDVAFPGGYVQLVNKLAAGQQILYGQVIQQVQYSKAGVTVLTKTGKFTAPYAIVTLPLGVLRSGAVNFQPTLPTWKAGAMSRLQMGRVDKLVLRFAKPFWDTNPTFLLRAVPNVDNFAWWFNAAPLSGQPILIAFIAGHLAQSLETVSDANTIQQLLAALRQWYGANNVPNPVDFQRTRWGQDPFALGCYPYKPVGSTSADYDFMSLPVPYAPNLPASANRLFFAGDATFRDHPTSAWGAYSSGLREAQRIALMLGKPLMNLKVVKSSAVGAARASINRRK